MADATRKQTLIADLASARTELVGYGQAIRHDLDLGSRVKRGVRSHPAAWFGGAALLGLLLSKIPRGRRKVLVKGQSFRQQDIRRSGTAALALTALKFALNFAKPALLKWVNGRMFPSHSRRV